MFVFLFLKSHITNLRVGDYLIISQFTNLIFETFKAFYLTLKKHFQISKTFADLHDTPQRMQAKGVIQDILDWKTSREFFYWRVKRRILESDVERKLKHANK